MTTIATPKTPEPMLRADFSWSPIGAAVTFAFAGNSYPPAGARFQSYYTPVNQLVTFVAEVVTTPGVPVVEYRWDLGDGTIKYGATIGHEYNVPNQSLMAKLEVLDAFNRRAYVAKALMLQVQFGTVVGTHVRG